MTKKAKRIMTIILLTVYALILAFEGALTVYGTLNSSVEILTVAFPKAALILLLADLPLFAVIAIVALVVGKVISNYNSFIKEKNKG